MASCHIGRESREAQWLWAPKQLSYVWLSGLHSIQIYYIKVYKYMYIKYTYNILRYTYNILRYIHARPDVRPKTYTDSMLCICHQTTNRTPGYTWLYAVILTLGFRVLLSGF